MTQSTSLAYNPTLPVNIWMKIGVISFLFLLVFADTLLLLVNEWTSRNDYSHGFLVPFISGYFVWLEREELKHIPIRPSVLVGAVVTATGGSMLLVGKIGGAVLIQQFSIITVIPGLVLIIGGFKYLWALTLPLAYLVLMVPFLDAFPGSIHWPFQLVSAIVSEHVLSFFDVPVFRDVQFLELPNISLEVAKGCSGVNYLISIIAIGVPLAYFALKETWKKILLIALALIIGIVANWVRIIFVGFWVYWGYGDGDIHGPMHIFQGVFVSIIGFVFLFIGAIVLGKLPGSKVSEPNQYKSVVNISHPNTNPSNFSWVMAGSLLLSFGVYSYTYNPTPVPLKKSLSEFPASVGDWKEANRGQPFKIHRADAEINRAYKNAANKKIDVYIGYFESQEQDKEFTTSHLQMLYNNNTEDIEVLIDSNNSTRINKTIINYNRRDRMVLFWYDLNGKIVPGKYGAKFQTIFNGLVHRQTNGAFVMVSSILDGSDEPETVLNNEKQFVRKLIPVIKKYLSQNET